MHRILVLNRGHLVGLVSAMDIATAVAERQLPNRSFVFDTSPVIRFDPDCCPSRSRGMSFRFQLPGVAGRISGGLGINSTEQCAERATFNATPAPGAENGVRRFTPRTIMSALALWANE